MSDRPVRWAHLDEIDYRTRPGSTAWFMNHSTGAQHLSAFRAMHVAHQTHENVHQVAVEMGHSSAGDMPLFDMLTALQTPTPKE